MSANRVLFDLPGPRTRRRHLVLSIVFGVLLLALLGWLVQVLVERGQITPEKWEPFLQRSAWFEYILPGIRATLTAAVFAVVLAFLLGLLLAMGRMSELAVVRWPSAVFVEFFRAVPVLIMMLFVFYLLIYQTEVARSQVPLV